MTWRPQAPSRRDAPHDGRRPSSGRQSSPDAEGSSTVTTRDPTLCPARREHATARVDQVGTPSAVPFPPPCSGTIPSCCRASPRRTHWCEQDIGFPQTSHHLGVSDEAAELEGRRDRPQLLLRRKHQWPVSTLDLRDAPGIYSSRASRARHFRRNSRSPLHRLRSRARRRSGNVRQLSARTGASSVPAGHTVARIPRS